MSNEVGANKKDEMGALGVAFMSAKKIKPTKECDKSKSIIDASVIARIDVKSYSAEELKKRAEIIAQRKLASQALIRKEEEISLAIEQIRSIPDWDLDSGLVREVEGLKTQLDNLEAMGGEDIRQSKEVCRLIEGITQAKPIDPDEVVGWIKEVARVGRGRILSDDEVEKCNSASGKWPDNAVVFDEKVCLVHMPSKVYVEGVSPTDKKIFYELKQLVSRYSLGVTKLKFEEMSSMGNPDLSGLMNGKPGIYRVYFASRKDQRTGRLFQEGMGVVELYDANTRPGDKPFLVVKAIDGAGSLLWLTKNRRFWVPLSVIRSGKVLKEKTLPDAFAFSEQFVRMMTVAVKYNNHQKK